jgi:hypothetical protein
MLQEKCTVPLEREELSTTETETKAILEEAICPLWAEVNIHLITPRDEVETDYAESPNYPI